MTNKLSKHAGGGDTKYVPAMMAYNGTTSFYGDESFTTSGNAYTGVIQFNVEEFTGTPQWLASVYIGSVQRFLIGIYGSDSATADRRNKLIFIVKNAAGTVICTLVSTVDVSTGSDVTAFLDFDGTAGIGRMYIHGINADDTGVASRVAPTTGTLTVGAGMEISVGSFRADVWTSGVMGTIGYFGYHDTIGLDPTDFYSPTQGLQEFDGSLWLLWNQYGQLEDNKGTSANMVATDIEIDFVHTVTFPILGINTIGDAVAADIATGKIAWVDGVEIVGTAI